MYVVEAVAVVATSPLPKSQLYVSTPPAGSDDPEASKLTANGATPVSALAVNEATGLPSVTVIVVVLVPVLLPSLTVNIAVYSPMAAYK